MCVSRCMNVCVYTSGSEKNRISDKPTLVLIEGCGVNEPSKDAHHHRRNPFKTAIKRLYV